MVIRDRHAHVWRTLVDGLELSVYGIYLQEV